MKISEYLNTLISILFFTFPILIIIGPLSLNIFSIIMSIYALININELKKLIFSKEKIFLGIILIIIFIFPFNDIYSKISDNQIIFNSSIFKFFSFIRYILMCFGIIIFLNLLNSNKLFLTKVKNYYLIYAFVISIDVIIELYFGSNIFGFYTYYPGRIASFTNEELIIGYVFSFIILFSLNDELMKLNKYLLIVFIGFIFILSFLIGERSNFIKLFTIIIFFSALHHMASHKFSFFKSSISVLIISLLVLGIFGLMKNTSQAKKFINFEMLKANEFSIKELYYNNKHFAHYDAAFKIFLNYPIFGIGINNFGNESKKEKYKSNKFSHTDQRSSTHPHQVYFEILAEVGLFGFLYIVLINFWITIKGIKLYFKEKSFSLLGNLMLHIFFLYPILPSGSFFGTNYGLPYWFNFSILVYQIYLKKIK